MSNMLNTFVKTDFVTQYGDYSFDYPLVNPDGTGHWSVYLFTIISVVASLSGIVVSATYQKPSEENKWIDNLYFYLGLGAIAIGTTFFLSGIGKYFTYSSQWYKWYNSLPSAGKRSYQQMKMMQGLISGIFSKKK